MFVVVIEKRSKESLASSGGDPSSLADRRPHRPPPSLFFTFSTYFKQNKTFPSLRFCIGVRIVNVLRFSGLLSILILMFQCDCMELDLLDASNWDDLKSILLSCYNMIFIYIRFFYYASYWLISSWFRSLMFIHNTRFFA